MEIPRRHRLPNISVTYAYAHRKDHRKDFTTNFPVQIPIRVSFSRSHAPADRQFIGKLSPIDRIEYGRAAPVRLNCYLMVPMPGAGRDVPSRYLTCHESS